MDFFFDVLPLLRLSLGTFYETTRAKPGNIFNEYRMHLSLAIVLLDIRKYKAIGSCFIVLVPSYTILSLPLFLDILIIWSQLLFRWFFFHREFVARCSISKVLETRLSNILLYFLHLKQQFFYSSLGHFFRFFPSKCSSQYQSPVSSFIYQALFIFFIYHALFIFFVYHTLFIFFLYHLYYHVFICINLVLRIFPLMDF